MANVQLIEASLAAAEVPATSDSVSYTNAFTHADAGSGLPKIAGSSFTVGDTYLIMACAVFANETTGRESAIRVTHGGTAFAGLEHHRDFVNSSSATVLYGFTVWTGANEDVQMEGLSTEATHDCEVHSARLVALNLSDIGTEHADRWNHDVHTPGTPDSVSSGWNDISAISETFTSGTSGKYLILATARFANLDNAHSVAIRIDVDGSAQYPTNVPWEEGENQSQEKIVMTYQKVLTLSAASHTIKMQTYLDSGGTCDLHHAELIAIRLTDVFAQFDDTTVGSGTFSSTSGYGDELAGGANVTTGAQADVLALGYVIGDSNGFRYFGARLQLDGTTNPPGQDATDIHDAFDSNDRYAFGAIGYLADVAASTAVDADLDGHGETTAVGYEEAHIVSLSMELAAGAETGTTEIAAATGAALDVTGAVDRNRTAETAAATAAGVDVTATVTRNGTTEIAAATVAGVDATGTVTKNGTLEVAAATAAGVDVTGAVTKNATLDAAAATAASVDATGKRTRNATLGVASATAAGVDPTGSTGATGTTEIAAATAAGVDVTGAVTKNATLDIAAATAAGVDATGSTGATGTTEIAAATAAALDAIGKVTRNATLGVASATAAGVDPTGSTATTGTTDVAAATAAAVDVTGAVTRVATLEVAGATASANDPNGSATRYATLEIAAATAAGVDPTGTTAQTGTTEIAAATGAALDVTGTKTQNATLEVAAATATAQDVTGTRTRNATLDAAGATADANDVTGSAARAATLGVAIATAAAVDALDVSRVLVDYVEDVATARFYVEDEAEALFYIEDTESLNA